MIGNVMRQICSLLGLLKINTSGKVKVFLTGNYSENT
jgi:hypothetical protein